MRRLLVVLLLFTGCATAPLLRQKLDPPFWDAPRRKVAVALGYVALPGITPEAGDRVHDRIAADPCDAALYGVIDHYDAAIADVLRAAVELFEGRGFQAAHGWCSRRSGARGDAPDGVS